MSAPVVRDFEASPTLQDESNATRQGETNPTGQRWRVSHDAPNSQLSGAPAPADASGLSGEPPLVADEKPSSRQPGVELVSTPPGLVLQPSNVEFQAGSESVFWTQVLSEVGDDVGNTLRKVSRLAIRGPNRLEVEFPKSYLFAKSLAEKPEARQRLDSVVARLAGRPIQVVFGISDEPAEIRESTPATKAARRLDTSTDGDPYVEKAIELFNAKIMKKESLARPSGQEM